MSDFNYQKAWFIFAKRGMENLNEKQQNALSKLLPLVKELQQGRDLVIPVSPAMEDYLNDLTCLELATLARASHSYGHWKPGKVEVIFNNSCGESWKVSNVIDQILRKRLNTPHNIQIHEGVLRVTFSNKDCWLWDEFGLATEENLKTYLTFKESHSFGMDTIDKSAKELKALIGDLWDDSNVDSLENTPEYISFLEAEKVRALDELKKDHAKKILKLKQDVINAKKELKAFQWLVKNNIDINNCIYYDHKDVFSFGWRETIENKPALIEALKEFPYKYEVRNPS